MDLIEAVKRNDVESVKTIIACGGVDLNRVDGNWWSALYCASIGGFVECVKVLLEAKADIEKADGVGYTPLHAASWKGHLQCVKV
jgi:uncharacterized protein